MKRASKLLSLLLAAVLLCSLLPTMAFAAAGTKEDPIPIKLGVVTDVPETGITYYSFTPEKDGAYTILGYGGGNYNYPDLDDIGKSTYLYAGEPYVFDAYYTHQIKIIDEGRFYCFGDRQKAGQYLKWDFDPDKATLTIAPGAGDGEMDMRTNVTEKFPWYSIENKIIHVVIGEGVTSVSPNAFNAYRGSEYGYTLLKDVSFPSTLKYIGKQAFYKCPALKEVSFPASLETIKEDAFFYCESLESAVFNGPTAVRAYAFEGCTALTDVTVNDPHMTEIYDMAFYNTPWIRSLAAENKGAAVVNNVLIGAYGAYDKKEGDGILVIPDGVKKIAPFALNNTTTHPAGGEQGSQIDWYLAEVVIPDSVTELMETELIDGPFRNCTDLERVTIGDGVRTLTEGCFENDYELREVNFGKNLKTIGDRAFKNTWLPGDLVIPDSVVTIGKEAFQNLDVYAGASWVDTNTEYGDFIKDKVYRPKDFSDRTITMGPNLKEIGQRAFDGWDKATVTIQGYDGTYAQQWAKDNGFQFKSLGAAPSTPAASGDFSDVPANAYYAEAVKWAVNHDPQITQGIGGGKFGPKGTVTRAQAVTFLWRAADRPEPKNMTSPFRDLTDPSAWYYKAVLWAAEEGITLGVSSDKFGLNGTLAYDQMLAFMCRAAGGDTSGDWSGKALRWAEDNGLTTGLDHIKAKGNCPRCDVVYCLWKEMAD